MEKLNTEKAAEIIGIKTGTLYIWRSNGKGPDYLKIGKKVFYDREVVEKWVKDQTVHQ